MCPYVQELELPETLDALDPRSGSGAGATLPPALLVELEDIQNIGGVGHLKGVGARTIRTRARVCVCVCVSYTVCVCVCVCVLLIYSS